jgi:glutamate-1-semialdehyde 2,1-aminomutase
VFFSEGPVTDYAGALAADHARYARFFNGMRARGVALAPSGFEAWFVSAAHSDEDVEATVRAVGEVARELGV